VGGGTRKGIVISSSRGKGKWKGEGAGRGEKKIGKKSCRMRSFSGQVRRAKVNGTDGKTGMLSSLIGRVGTGGRRKGKKKKKTEGPAHWIHFIYAGQKYQMKGVKKKKMISKLGGEGKWGIRRFCVRSQHPVAKPWERGKMKNYG